MASSRNAGWVGIVGLRLMLMMAVMSLPHVVIAQAALGAFVLAETVRYEAPARAWPPAVRRSA